MELTEAQTMTWRLRRHSLVPPQESGVAEVIDRVVAMRAWPMHAAENAIRIRRANSIRGPNSETRTLTSPRDTLTSPQETLAEAQQSGSVIRSYALRGGSYFFTPKTGANLLSAHTATQSWRSSRFQRQGSFAIDDWEPLREAVHEACSLGPRTREEISAEVQTIPSLRHLQKGLSGAGADSLYKPLHWWGDICFGPTRDGQSTFRWLRDDPAWPGLPPVDEAGMQAITDYAHSYGPVTWDNLRYWFVAGLGVRRATVDQWLTSMSDILVPVTVRGVDAFVLADDLDDIRSMPRSMPQSMSQQETLLFLPGYDPWLMGPGTADTRIVPADHRALASRGANTIVHNGIVAGVWKASAHDVRIHWLDETRPIPRSLLDEQVGELGESLGRELTATFAVE